MNAHVYNEIITTRLVPFIELYFNDYDVILHQDNSPIHRSEECIRLLNDLNILSVK